MIASYFCLLHVGIRQNTMRYCIVLLWYCMVLYGTTMQVCAVCLHRIACLCLLVPTLTITTINHVFSSDNACSASFQSDLCHPPRHSPPLPPLPHPPPLELVGVDRYSIDKCHLHPLRSSMYLPYVRGPSSPLFSSPQTVLLYCTVLNCCRWSSSRRETRRIGGRGVSCARLLGEDFRTFTPCWAWSWRNGGSRSTTLSSRTLSKTWR